MSDKPCTHCGGSGKEPDALQEAYEALEHAIAAAGADARVDAYLAAKSLFDAALHEREQHEARIVFLEAALRDILSRFTGPLLGGMQVWQARNEDIANWKAVLDNTPGRLNADGTCPGGC